jgi:hypothetical protein
MTWYLTVKTKSGDEHMIRIGPNEDAAVSALNDAKGNIGMNGVVTIQNRLALQAADIVAVYIRDDTERPRFKD